MKKKKIAILGPMETKIGVSRVKYYTKPLFIKSTFLIRPVISCFNVCQFHCDSLPV